MEFDDGTFTLPIITPEPLCTKKVPNTEFYDRLELRPDAIEYDIKKAFRKKAHSCHPDLCKGDKKELEKKFHSLKEAYDTLINEKARAVYDETGINTLNIDKKIKHEAIDIFHTVFTTTLDEMQDIEHVDPLLFVKAKFQVKLNQISLEREMILKVQAKIQKVKSKLKAKNNETSLINVVDVKLDGYLNALLQNSHSTKVIQEAKNLVDSYSYEIDPQTTYILRF